MRAARTATATIVVTLAGLGLAPAAAGQGGDCLTADPPPISAPPHPLRFGITPLLAGSVGASQLEPKPGDPAATGAALSDLRPRGRRLVLRLNRMFWADGGEGIRRYKALVDRFAAAGFETELQVRYHPPEGMAGNMPAWKRYVKRVVRVFGRRDSVVALSITNEANFDVSPNTSDGSYPGVREAVVKGISIADRKLRRMGRRDVGLGFSFAWRWIPAEDRAFWEEIGARSTPRFLRALDYVGLQLYPGLVWPPVSIPGRTAGDEVIEALTLMRSCYLPKAGLGPDVDLWVSENGYATNLGRTEASQAAALDSTLAEVARYSGTLGISDYRYFNLRDNNTTGPDLFDAVGLLRDDYERKPAFAVLRDAIRTSGVVTGR